MAGLGMIFGGMAKGYGDGLVEQAKAKREEALAQLKFERDRQLAGEARSFQAEQDEKTRAFQSNENALTRSADADYRNKSLGLQERTLSLQEQNSGEVLKGTDGDYVRRGTTAVPITDEAGNRISQRTETVRDLTPAEKEARGLDPKKPYQVDQTGKILEVGGGGTTVNLNNGEGDSFYKKLDEKNAENFSAMSDAGVKARGRMGQIERLEALMEKSPSGAEAAIKESLGKMGINTENLDYLQSATALIERMVPEQRTPGSGPMSDADVQMYRSSLPRVINQPGGNRLIFDTLKGIAQYDAKIGEIADAVADRSITPEAGRQQIQALENPLDAYKIAIGEDKPTSGTAGSKVKWKVLE